MEVGSRRDDSLQTVGSILSDGRLEGHLVHGRQEVARREVLDGVNPPVGPRGEVERASPLTRCGLETLTQRHTDRRKARLVRHPIESTAVVAEGDQVLEPVETRHDAW